AVAEGGRGGARDSGQRARDGALRRALGRVRILGGDVEDHHLPGRQLELDAGARHHRRPLRGVAGEGAERGDQPDDGRRRAHHEQQHEADDQHHQPAALARRGGGRRAGRGSGNPERGAPGVLQGWLVPRGLLVLRGLLSGARPLRRSILGGRDGTRQPVAGAGARGGRRALAVGHRGSFQGRSRQGSGQASEESGRAAAQAPTLSRATPVTAAPSTAEASGVSTQVARIVPATGQRTVRRPRAAPAPVTLAAREWEVETGDSSPNTPSDIIAAAEVSAARPCATERSVRRRPRVRMIRCPPWSVPAATATETMSIIVSTDGPSPEVVASATITTASGRRESLSPCPAATAPAETVWANRRCPRWSRSCRPRYSTPCMSRYAIAAASSGPITEIASSIPRRSQAAAAPIAREVPSVAPKKACQVEDGIPTHQVSRSHRIVVAMIAS